MGLIKIGGISVIRKGIRAKFLGSPVKIEPKIKSSSLKNLGLGKKWEGNGFLFEWLMNGTDSVVMLCVRSQQGALKED